MPQSIAAPVTLEFPAYATLHQFILPFKNQKNEPVFQGSSLRYIQKKLHQKPTLKEGLIWRMLFDWINFRKFIFANYWFRKCGYNARLRLSAFRSYSSWLFWRRQMVRVRKIRDLRFRENEEPCLKRRDTAVIFFTRAEHAEHLERSHITWLELRSLRSLPSADS